MISVNFAENEKQQMVWALTEKDQLAHSGRKTQDGAIVGIVEWDKYRGTLPCTPVVQAREGVVVPAEPTVSTRDSFDWRKYTEPYRETKV